jgi:hypothetical protein
MMMTMINVFFYHIVLILAARKIVAWRQTNGAASMHSCKLFELRNKRAGKAVKLKFEAQTNAGLQSQSQETAND